MAKFKKNLKANNQRKIIKLTSATPTIIQEAYKSIRTNLLFTLGTSSKKSVVISSSGPSECKSTTAANLAITTAQLGAKVLLIDGDMRKPTIHKIFRLNNDKGLSRLVVKFDELKSCVHKKVEENLDVLTSGPIPPNPAELIGSPGMSELLAKFEEEYDFVFIDTPPVNMVADAVIFAPQTAGVILLVRQGRTTYPELERTVAAVKFSKAEILGIIIADSKNFFSSKYSYKNRYKYKYGYNYSYTSSAGSTLPFSKQ